MEKIIFEIIEADKAARTLVSQKQQERRNIQNLIQERHDEIKRKYQEETTQILAKRREEMKEELNAQMKVEHLAFEEALSGLQKQYDEQKKQWINTIVNRCLHA